MGCGLRFVKYLLFLFNLLIVLLGITIIGIGVVIHLNWDFSDSELILDMPVAPWIFIIIGAIMFVIAFFGCWGAIRESRCLVVTYAIFLILIVIVEVVIGGLLYMHGDDVKEKFLVSVKIAFEERRSHEMSNNGTDTFINNIQELFSCCGFKDAIDYYGAQSFISLPDSCCNITNFYDSCKLVFANSGCESVITVYYNSWNELIAFVATGFASIEMCTAILALCLAYSIGNIHKGPRRTTRIFN